MLGLLAVGLSNTDIGLLQTVTRDTELALGVAVVALSCLGSLEVQTAVTLLGIGLACAGAAMLTKQ